MKSLLVYNHSISITRCSHNTTGTLASTLGADNPLRYRSYYYDIDSGLYYLQSRYYDPELGRFLNADSYASTGQGILGHNMFAYCRNNPVCRKDIPGTTDEAIADDDSNLLHDEKSYEGGQMNNGGSGGKGGGGSGRGASFVSKPSVNDGGRFPQNAGGQGNSTPSKIRTPDQQALHDLARQIERDAHQGKFITQKEAELLDSWANEYGVYQHHKAIVGSGEHWRTGWDHTHIYNIHVPFATYR